MNKPVTGVDEPSWLEKLLNLFGLTPDEWHAWWIGFFQEISRRKAHIPVSIAQLGYIQTEYHYYEWGRAIGFIFFVVLCAILVLGIAVFIMWVLL